MKRIVAIAVFIIVVATSIQAGIVRKNGIKDIAFDKAIESLMKTAHMSALSACIVKDGKVIWAKGYGLYDRENGKKADENTIYLVASISKTITATAIMQLYEKGKLNINDDVNKYLPFKLRNPNYPDIPITIKMLLSHTSSLAVDPPAFYSYFPGDLEIKGYPYPWLKEYLVPGGIQYRNDVWSNVMPGEKLQYANVGFSLLGYIVELVSNESFEKYCEENIFHPLGMYNTSFFMKNLNVSRMAIPYEYHGKYEPLLHYAILDYPAGGLRTTVMDLSRFLIAHINNGIYNGVRILDEKDAIEMHTPHAHGNYAFEYGYGFQIWHIGGDTYIGHTGGLYGVATKMVYRLSDKVGVIFFTNKEVRNLREITAFAMIERLLFWKATHNARELSSSIIQQTIEADKSLLDEFTSSATTK